jgi:hypothetical protein
MMDHLVIAGFVFLNLFMIVGAVDLFYFHIWKYKLHTRPESLYEHKLHMAFAFLMVPLAYFLYYQNSGGWALWAAAFFVIAALSTEMLDVFIEGDSRASLGGLSTGEYSIHVAATILKVASFALMFASKPAAAWDLWAPIVQGEYGSMAEMIALQVMIGSGLVAILHLALLHPRIAAINCKAVCGVAGCSRFACCTSSAAK